MKDQPIWGVFIWKEGDILARQKSATTNEIDF